MSKDLTVIAKRYASALFEVVGQENLDKAEAELRLVKSIMEQNHDIQKILNHPKISVQQKKQIVKDSIGTDISAPVLNTVFLLIDRNRQGLITEMASQFIGLANESRGIADATVYSVRLLSADEKRQLEETFAKRVGKQRLRIENIIDQSLVGGVRIRIGNRIFDGSVRGKLERIERQLAATQG
ncbi:F0F1 ATP synthase subunit delta [Fictibacillus sp. WQ 8-8]|uniref:F0F1 ATP synthase subunit delta n=1 Tax=unclassified Fictibacillus TaxID=2644029 RepID=UPI0008DFFDF6|nr:MULTISPECIES: F0F1 ATP synthase subunit delta [unclassified Fictibacillus]MCQ6264895.1 F0F1 ATP synthase subunit delta [Fictibacillus sp. WQ 8-8]MED2970869.1 F0F1 ATP synthase subunit delta [Fictibacillus sp. B-59209]SFE85545.1 ATP synthase F1 subcomplex delta subunit [Bacillus sp. OV194]